MEVGVAQAILAIVGSVAILAWPILVMLLRAAVEGRRWRNRLMARAWISAWFAGSGIWVVAAWITVIVLIRLLTGTILADQPAVEVMSWVLIIAAMVVIIPFSWRAPKEPKG